LQYILHDWSDEDCVKILKQCKKAVCSGNKPSGGKVIIIDTVVGSAAKDAFEAQVTGDLLMMVMTSGKERDEHEWRRIFMEAGFQHYKTRPVLGFLSIIELYQP
jgi:trans-resveratrol di-O-methyltransferase